MNSSHKHVEVGLGGGAGRACRVQSTRLVGLGEVQRDLVAADTAVRRGIGPQEVLLEPKHRYIVIDGGPDVIDKQDWSVSARERNHVTRKSHLWCDASARCRVRIGISGSCLSFHGESIIFLFISRYIIDEPWHSVGVNYGGPEQGQLSLAPRPGPRGLARVAQTVSRFPSWCTMSMIVLHQQILVPCLLANVGEASPRIDRSSDHRPRRGGSR